MPNPIVPTTKEFSEGGQILASVFLCLQVMTSSNKLGPMMGLIKSGQ
jgi:hypothetical protein